MPGLGLSPSSCVERARRDGPLCGLSATRRGHVATLDVTPGSFIAVKASIRSGSEHFPHALECDFDVFYAVGVREADEAFSVGAKAGPGYRGDAGFLQ